MHEGFKEPWLCLENVETSKRQIVRLGYDGPVAMSTDCTKVRTDASLLLRTSKQH
jgi:hypothetical protein